MAYLYINNDITVDELNDITPKSLGKWTVTNDHVTNNEDVLTLQVPNTFRFNTRIVLLPAASEHALIVCTETDKSSRTHINDEFDRAINDLSFRAEHLSEPLTRLLEHLSAVGYQEPHEEQTLPESGELSFSADHDYGLLMTLLCAVYPSQKQPSFNEMDNAELVAYYNNPLAPAESVISYILNVHGLLTTELDQLLEMYTDAHPQEGTIVFGEKTELLELISFIPQLPNYPAMSQMVIDKYKKQCEAAILYAVIDKQSDIAYVSKCGEHYQTIVKIISATYYPQFSNMSQTQKDDFILNNFKLVGNYYTETSQRYVPSDLDVEMHYHLNNYSDD